MPRRSLAPVGRFGTFGYGYRIAPRKVTLARNPWLAAPGVPLVAGGAVAFVVVPGVLAYAGVIMLVIGAMLTVAGLLPPRRVTATAEGLRWGGAWIAAATIQSIVGELRTIRVKGSPVTFTALMVACDGAPNRELRLHDGDVHDPRVDAIASAMATLVGKTKKHAKG